MIQAGLLLAPKIGLLLMFRREAVHFFVCDSQSCLEMIPCGLQIVYECNRLTMLLLELLQLSIEHVLVIMPPISPTS